MGKSCVYPCVYDDSDALYGKLNQVLLASWCLEQYYVS